MESHQPYHEIFHRQCDFRVKYEFLPLENSTVPQILGTSQEPHRLLYQGIRLDFFYPNEGEFKNSHYMIWPEFEDKGGFLILDRWMPIEPTGTARMWIFSKNFIGYHRKYLKIGMTGYMTDGKGYNAKCEVIELINLL